MAVDDSRPHDSHEAPITPSLGREHTFSPRELADAVGVSESSIKRWIDAGEIAAARTAGGHRRVTHREAVRFVRERGLPIVDPEALRLPGFNGEASTRAGTLTAEALTTAVREGEAHRARDLVVAEYVRGTPLAALCDGPLRETLEHFGALWQQDLAGIGVEHEATEVFVQAIGQIRALRPPLSADAPIAVGGAAPDDPYFIPSLMAAAVLENLGFHVVNFGPNTPLHVLRRAAEERRARLVWLSVSTPDAAAAITAEGAASLARLAEAGVQVIAGGRFAAEAGLEGALILPSMQALANAARPIVGQRD